MGVGILEEAVSCIDKSLFFIVCTYWRQSKRGTRCNTFVRRHMSRELSGRAWINLCFDLEFLRRSNCDKLCESKVKSVCTVGLINRALWRSEVGSSVHLWRLYPFNHRTRFCVLIMIIHSQRQESIKCPLFMKAVRTTGEETHSWRSTQVVFHVALLNTRL